MNEALLVYGLLTGARGDDVVDPGVVEVGLAGLPLLLVEVGGEVLGD